MKTRTIIKKLSHTALSFALLLQMSGLAALMPALPVKASPICQNDLQGANDEPGQKDLTKMCSSVINASSKQIIWNWDEISVSGANTLDACSLYDTDGDGKANYSLCSTTTNGTSATTRLYTCNDTRSDRCSGSSNVAVFTSNCTVGSQATDPFGAGASSPNDMVATCTVINSEVGSGSLIDVCSYPSQQPNSDPSDCIVATSETTTIELIKSVNDTGIFDLYVGMTKWVDDGPNGSTTGPVSIDDRADIVLSEKAGSGSLLSNYTTTTNCLDKSGDSVDIDSSNLNDSSVRWFKIDSHDIDKNETITCTLTNTRKVSNLTVVKTLIQDDGIATKSVTDFGFQVDGGSVIPFEADGSNTISYPTGTVIASVTEPSVAGFATTYSNCEDLTIVAGQTQTCTITNNDIAPTLTVIKDVTNDDGGKLTPLSFPLFVDDTSVTHNVSTNSFDTGSYVISETQQSGYLFTDVTGDCVYEQGVITIGLNLGGTYTCTLINDDIAPTLTLRKKLITDNGGSAKSSDWTLTATPETTPDDPTISGNGEDGITQETAKAAVKYTLTEEGPIGYSPGTWSCEGGELEGNVLIMSLGDDVTCEITNDDDAPEIIIEKRIVGGDWDDEFDFEATYGDEESETFALSAGEDYSFNPDAGSVTITESVDSEQWSTYILCWVGEEQSKIDGVTVTLDISLGESIYCEYHNIAKATIEVTKFEDLNKNGVMDEAENTLDGWEIQAHLTDGDDTTTILEATTVGGMVTFSVFGELGYDFEISETLKNGWEQTGLYCDDPILPDQSEPSYDRRLVRSLQIVDEIADSTTQPGGLYRCYIGNYKKPITAVLSDTITPPVTTAVLSNTGAKTTVPTFVAGLIIFAALSMSSYRRKEQK